MEYPEIIYVKDYFKIHEHYKNIYGPRTIILMQVGSFHEAYATDTDGLDLVSLSESLDVACTKKNGSLPLSKSNPRMMGFPIYVTQNFIEKLIDMFYTVVLINQVTEPPNPERKVTNIYSPGTYIEKKNSNTNYIASITLEVVQDNLIIGLATYDLTTGQGYFYETHSSKQDIMIGLDDTLRFLESYEPREIILESKISNYLNLSEEEILGYLSIDKNKVFTFKEHKLNKIQWQKHLLNEVYKSESNIDLIQILNLDKYNWARLSLCLLLEYINNHQPRLLEHIKKPIEYSNSLFLYLGNRALEQLDVFNNNTSLYDIINSTKTALGKRYLHSQITRPLININKLNERYEAISKLINNKKYEQLSDKLNDIYDLDKLIRRLEMNIIHPFELNQIYLSTFQIENLFNYLKQNKLLETFSIEEKQFKLIKNFNTYFKNRFIQESVSSINFNNWFETDKSFYEKNIYEEIDSIQEKINLANNFITELVSKLESYIDDKVIFKKKDPGDKTLINVKCNDRDGHYLLITNRRLEMMKKKIGTNTFKIGSITLGLNDLTLEQLPKSNNTKISCVKMNNLSKELVSLKIKLATSLKNSFKEDCSNIVTNYLSILNYWSNKIAYIDFINSGAITASKNHYVKPTINETSSSFFKATEMRHPILEKLYQETNYIPHSIELGPGTEQDGILLYGINSSGKSTLMKSIGLNIIMAQIGYYVACSDLEYYPYTSIFTRISGADNMFKGLSSFMVEMMELMAILKRNNNRSLVLADEVCRGTEEKSSNIIVAYMLEALSKSQTSFITATHLHRLNTMECVKTLKRVKAKHLKITHDAKNDRLIYDRHLSDGQGETFYGLQVAKYLMRDNLFNERTLEIMKEYDNINVKESKYNKNIIVDKCALCSSTEKIETHHIVWQKDFVDGLNKEKIHLQRDSESNLVPLCSKCHDDVDRGKIIINGYKDTSNGTILDWYQVENVIKSSKTYDPDVINYIMKLKTKKIDVKMARLKVKDKFNKKISTTTINKFWS